ncbi:unnamed protein product [Anisakis simplex]|uniref:Uncharacterized protein n=1 Tax=Anisakis simplex TaxID=6269 RepID=A0A3P6NPA6_ANISI|nr:unnamed protein product [Anisakis simplex]
MQNHNNGDMSGRPEININVKEHQQGPDEQNGSQQPEIPPFLVGTPMDVQRRFFDIVSNRDETFEQKQVELDELMSNLDKKKQVSAMLNFQPC